MTDSADPWRWWRRRAQVRRALRRTLLARRRPLAALCAAGAVLGVVHVVRPDPPRSVTVVVAARDLPAGVVLGPDDLTVRRFPARDVPAGAAPRAVGRTLAAPVRAGEVVTDVRLVSPTLVTGYPGRVLVPVRVADPDSVGLLRTGDHVDLLAADPRSGRASYVATDVPVVAMPEPSEPGAEAGAPVAGRLVVVAASPDDVTTIAGAQATELVSVVLTD